MFGRNRPINVHVNSTTPVTNYTTVEVHNPPTADVTKFLKELETEAQKKIDQTIRVEDNTFKAIIYLMKDMLNDSSDARIIFNLNGVDLNVTASVEGIHKNNTQMLLEKLRDAVARKIAAEIVINAFSNMRVTL